MPLPWCKPCHTFAESAFDMLVLGNVTAFRRLNLLQKDDVCWRDARILEMDAARDNGWRGSCRICVEFFEVGKTCLAVLAQDIWLCFGTSSHCNGFRSIPEWSFQVSVGWRSIASNLPLGREQRLVQRGFRHTCKGRSLLWHLPLCL